MLTISDKQKAALASIKSGPGFIAIKHAGALRSAGLIDKADVEGSKPGYTGARLTANGHKAVEAF